VLQSLGFAAGAVLKEGDLAALSSDAILSLHPSALVCLLGASDIVVPPTFLASLSPEQAASIPLAYLPTMVPAQLRALSDAAAATLPPALAEPLHYLLHFHASCNVCTGCVNAADVAVVPPCHHECLARALPRNLAAMQPYEAAQLPGTLLAALSEPQLMSLTKEHVQVPSTPSWLTAGSVVWGTWLVDDKQAANTKTVDQLQCLHQQQDTPRQPRRNRVTS
jgi:hypothetical protein